MGEQPKLTSREPWDLAMAFAEMLNRNANTDVNNAAALEQMQLGNTLKKDSMRYGAEIGYEFGPKTAAATESAVGSVRERFNERTEQRAEARYNRQKALDAATDVDTDRKKKENEIDVFTGPKAQQYYQNRNTGRSQIAGLRPGEFFIPAEQWILEKRNFKDTKQWEVRQFNLPNGKYGYIVRDKTGLSDGAKSRIDGAFKNFPGMTPAPASPISGGGGGSDSATPMSYSPGDTDDNATNTAAEEALNRYVIGVRNAPERFQPLIEAAAARHGVDPDLLAAQAWQESRFRTNAVSPAGARGISQFMPGTARDYGVDVNDPASSLNGQARYMAKSLERYGNNTALALASYNWGTGNVDRWLASGAKINRMPKETRDYIATITGKPVEEWLGTLSTLQAGDDTYYNEDNL